MSIAGSIASALAGNAPLMVILTGGARTYGDTGRSGISPSSVPAAYDANGVIKPNAIVLDRSENPWGGVRDRPTKTKSLRNVVEVYIYDDGDNLYDTAVEPAGEAIALLLDEQFVSGAGWLKLVNRLKDQRDPGLNNAIFNRLDFQVVHLRSAS